MKIILSLFSILCFFYSCTECKRDKRPLTGSGDTTAGCGQPSEIAGTTRNYWFHDTLEVAETTSAGNDTIIDADYSFEEAIAGTKAPPGIINQLTLFGVVYLSTDGKIHCGQILSNKTIANDIKKIFRFMLDKGFVIEKAIPIVKYGWNDSLSMEDNNSYSFCYRDIAYSKHATGMAIDINPRFNPLRWKTEDRPNKPQGAVLDTTVNGTLYPGHPVVEEFRRLGFRWGHSFTKFHDDHHFEKK
ncbi:M15 family metallopeptidase [Proteiniphilum sp. X52]|uniref:M15 family metallopeptidase n=1 Tax=Proteiniphilum sp. X52 TaxID=2382159 RepID=UPI000F0A61F5|nr:M15 family metallopeptidase [Proteiniphilum sp. X52]RNC66366.1 M15 family peptidase [Proteiniphilum sp. X52]